MPKRYLVTAGLPYSNGRLHVGHIGGAYLPADTYVRYLRARGAEVLWVCGSDDNGVAIEISAIQAGTTPQEISTHFHQRQKADFAALGITFDVYGGTHQPGYRETHEALSQSFFTNIHARGQFTKKTSKQLFDPQAQRFLPDRYVKGTCHYCGAPGATGDQCEACGQMIDPLLLKDPVSEISGQPAEIRETTHWYMQLGAFEAPLRDWLETKRGQWRAGTLNFALGQIKNGLPERAMTRDIEWGIPVPLDDPDAKGKVLFVWFDAPIGYISFTAQLLQDRGDGPEAYLQWWASADCDVVHFIGEDNTVFHTLTWPAMLMADGRFNVPAHVVANNFINFRLGDSEAKVSKSKTGADSPVWIEEYVKRFDPDALRYYLTAIAPESARTAFDPADFVARNNNELVAALGNFINRTLQFATRYFEGAVPPAAARSAADAAHLERGPAVLAKVGALIEGFRFRAAIEAVMSYARDCNQHFGAREPWASRKIDMADCGAAIATCIESVRVLAVLISPFMPRTAARIRQQLGEPESPWRWEPPSPLPAGHRLGEPAILFAKLEEDAFQQAG